MARYQLRIQRQVVSLSPGLYRIGRGSDCHIVVEDPQASRRHAVLYVAEDGVAVEDTASRVGLFVNDVRVPGRIDLTHGDRIRVGATSLVLNEVGPSRPTAATARVFMSAADAIVTSLSGGGQGSARTPEALARASLAAIDYALASRAPEWIDRVLDAHAERLHLMSSPTLERLRQAIETLGSDHEAALLRYLGALSERSGRLDVSDQVLLRRVESLLRVRIS